LDYRDNQKILFGKAQKPNYLLINMRLPLRVPNKHLIVVGGNHAFAGYVGIYRNAADQ